jgi:hypothetical protein
MSLDPMCSNDMLLAERIECSPEVFILHRLILRALPAPGNPVVQPCPQTINDVFAITVEIDGADFGDALQTFDHPHQFHSVVCCGRIASVGHLLFSAEFAEDESPAAGPGISGTSPIGKELIRGLFIHLYFHPVVKGLKYGFGSPITAHWKYQIMALELKWRGIPTWYSPFQRPFGREKNHLPYECRIQRLARGLEGLWTLGTLCGSINRRSVF